MTMCSNFYQNLTEVNHVSPFSFYLPVKIVFG
jgi:hypothetical protein